MVAVADFLELDYLLLASDFLQMATADAGETTADDTPSASPPLPPHRAVLTSLLNALSLAVGAYWVLVVTAVLLMYRATIAGLDVARRQLEAHTPQLLTERLLSASQAKLAAARAHIVAYVERKTATVPPRMRHLAAVTAATVARQTSPCECLAEYRSALAMPMAELCLKAEGAVGENLVARVPAKARAACTEALAVHWPELISEWESRRSCVAEGGFSTPLRKLGAPGKDGDAAGCKDMDDDATVIFNSDAASSSTYSLSTLADATSAAATPLFAPARGGIAATM